MNDLDLEWIAAPIVLGLLILTSSVASSQERWLRNWCIASIGAVLLSIVCMFGLSWAHRDEQGLAALGDGAPEGWVLFQRVFARPLLVDGLLVLVILAIYALRSRQLRRRETRRTEVW